MLFIEVPLLGLCRLDHTKKSNYREEREVSQFYSINVYLNTIPQNFTSQVTFISLTKITMVLLQMKPRNHGYYCYMVATN